ncbi:uncharacterized protein LOC141715077 [Apium graveolens]|uniref:uncharacterized protein LOC141715077 n=1 Tax=Apium graveolens TaxID=4045 RepID=UPI003D7AD98D
MEELGFALKSFSNDKAPGPDGITMRYIKEFWVFLKEKILEGFISFARLGVLPSGCNFSFISLVPKAQRLSRIYDKLIDVNQFGFVKGRQAAESIILVNEVYHTLKSFKNQGVILKLDFEKVFDTVNWNFLFKTMECLSLGSNWIKWMHDLFKSIRISVQTNDYPSKEFSISNGLRQGDLLSPMPFNLAGEVLSQMLNKAAKLGLIEENELDLFAGILGCKEGKWPLSYLGSQIGGNASKEEGVKVKKMHLKAWNMICKPKKLGGLGLSSLQQRNLVLLSKWWFRWQAERKLSWNVWLREKYGSELWLRLDKWSNPMSCSVVVKDVLSVVASLSNFCPLGLDSLKWEVSDGESTLFWEDLWDEEVFWSRKLRSWELDELKELDKIVGSLQLSCNPDVLIWILLGDKFSCKAAYNLLSEEVAHSDRIQWWDNNPVGVVTASDKDFWWNLISQGGHDIVAFIDGSLSTSAKDSIAAGIGGIVYDKSDGNLLHFAGPSIASSDFEVECFALETLFRILKDSCWKHSHILVLSEYKQLVNQVDVTDMQYKLWNCKVLTVQVKHIVREMNGVVDGNARRGARLSNLEISS